MNRMVTMKRYLLVLLAGCIVFLSCMASNAKLDDNPQPDGFIKPGGYTKPDGAPQLDSYPKMDDYPKPGDFPQQDDYSQSGDYPQAGDNPQADDYLPMGDYPHPDGYTKPGGYTKPDEAPQLDSYPKLDDYPKPSENPQAGDYLQPGGPVEGAPNPYHGYVDVECNLSEPTFTREDGHVIYKTILQIKDMSEFYGYQIKVSSAGDDLVEVENRAGGVTTPAVYKDDKVNLAVIVGEGASGDIEVCEITSKYPYSDKNNERMLIVDQLDVITSIMAERTVTLGPSPVALTLALPYVSPPFYATSWFRASVAAFLLIVVSYAYKRRRSKTPQPLGMSVEDGANKEQTTTDNT